ncbi:hypothetical protein V1509DRAFT_623049 [Lipomyces kononenkoae]
MEILHVSVDASPTSHPPLELDRDNRHSAQRRTPSPVLGKRRRWQGSYHHDDVGYDKHSSFDTSSDNDETTRDELVVEHLQDHVRTSQRWLSQIRVENSSSSHSTTSTSIDSGNSRILDSRPPTDDRSEFPELPDVSAVATTQDRHVRLATAAANFSPFRRHMVHKFRLEICIHSKNESLVESSVADDSHAWTKEKDDSAYGAESKRLDGVSLTEERTKSLSELSPPKVDYTDLIRTWHSDSIVPDSCPVPVLLENEDLRTERSTPASVSNDLTGPIDAQAETHDWKSKQDCPGQGSILTTHEDSDTSNQERSMCNDIDLSQSLRFWTRPPKISSLEVANQKHVLPPASPPKSSSHHGYSNTQAQSLKLTDAHNTPIQTNESSSQQSSFTSPDRIPTRIPVFGATLSLAQLLGKEDPHEVYYPPESNSTDSGSDASENMGTNGSSETKVKIVTRTLKKQMDVAFRRKDYYTPRARCVRVRADDRDRQEWPPDQLERGYWRVDVSSWLTNEKMKFWDNITQAIRAGRIGWIGAVVEGVNEIGKGDVVRVYCFGGAVVHVWVFLFAMSNRRTVKDVQWIDGVGRTVIEVGEELPIGMVETKV